MFAVSLEHWPPRFALCYGCRGIAFLDLACSGTPAPEEPLKLQHSGYVIRKRSVGVPSGQWTRSLSDLCYSSCSPCVPLSARGKLSLPWGFCVTLFGTVWILSCADCWVFCFSSPLQCIRSRDGRLVREKVKYRRLHPLRGAIRRVRHSTADGVGEEGDPDRSTVEGDRATYSRTPKRERAYKPCLESVCAQRKSKSDAK